MGDVKTLLAVTLVVMSAGGAIYTIKTYMQPGMKVAINLAEIKDQNIITDEKYETLRKTTHYTVATTQSTSSGTVLETTTVVPKITVRRPTKPTPTKPPKITMKPTRPSPLEESSVTYDIDESTKKEVEGRPIRKRSIVDTPLGKIEGIDEDAAGKRVMAFLGVKYALPPVGDLRFKMPKPIKQWKDVKLAKEYGSPCIQHFPNSTDIPMTFMRKDYSEDCLHLNIWTPSTKKLLRAVMVFIHGGVFIFGSNSVEEYDGRMLSSYGDVVVVSINYRLGPFGFMDAGIEDTPGNMGLHDMLLALKWIQNNIESFGGDPKMVTIIGHQSGAMATSMFLTSPLAKDLFKRAILHSGSLTMFNFYYQKSFQSTQNFAEILGCSDDRRNLTNDAETVMQCLRDMPIQRLKRAADDQLSEALFSYSPVIGDDILPQSPKDTVDDYRNFGNQKELMIGANSDEGAMFFHLGNPEMFRRDKAPTVNDIDTAKKLLASSLKDWGLSKSTLTLMNSFFLEKTKSVEPKILLKALHDVFGDLAFMCPSVYFSEKFSERNNRSAYFYYYTHRSNNHYQRGDWFGTTHFDELPFVFGHPLRYPQKYSGADIDFSKVMMLIWTTFAKTGKPPAVSGREWPQYTSDNQEYVELNGRHMRDGRMGTGFGPHKDNCDTWKYAFRVFN